MRAGAPCTFVISWTQTEVDGLRGAPPSALDVGAAWRWAGEPVRIDGPTDILPLNGDARLDALHAHAAVAARRLMGRSVAQGHATLAPSYDDPLLKSSFTVTDGTRAWVAALIDVPELSRPLVMFTGDLPPRLTELRVVKGRPTKGRTNRVTDTSTGVICFTRGTWLRTPEGERQVEDLAEGDRIDTVDAGPQQIVWIGRRRMTGARLYTMPELRPIRIRAGALGHGEPPEDLLVSPKHKVLVKGPVAQALFNTPEVLASVEDLLNDHSITRDHRVHEVEYIHFLLPRHHVVWANGVETESFHPASTNLDTIEPAQRTRLTTIVPGIEADPHGYGPSVRRELTRPEAAILRHEGLTR
ncbi:MAG: Hint domain-containing protein [Pseudomonadota bacterium]